MHLLRYVFKCTVTDSPFNTETVYSKCLPSAWIHFLAGVTRELVTLRSTAALLMFLAVLRILWSSSSLMFTLCAYTATTNPSVWESMIRILPDDLTEMRRRSVMLVAHLTCL